MSKIITVALGWVSILHAEMRVYEVSGGRQDCSKQLCGIAEVLQLFAVAFISLQLQGTKAML